MVINLSERAASLALLFVLRADRASLSLSMIVNPGISFGFSHRRGVFFKFHNCRKEKRARIIRISTNFIRKILQFNNMNFANVRLQYDS